MHKINLQFTKIQHIGIPVTDLSRSILFYQNLGFELVMDSPFDYQGESGRCVMMNKGEILLELYQFPSKALEAILMRKDGHIDHLAFDVQDIKHAFDILKTNGFIPIEPEPVILSFWSKGCRYFNILGPDGERLEFNQIL